MADTVLNAQVLMAFKTVGTARSLREIGRIESALNRTPDNKTIRINTPGVNQATRVLSVMTDTLTALQAAGAKVSQAKVFSTAFGMAGMDTEAFDKYAEADNTPTATYSKAKGVGGVVNAQAVSLLNEYADGLRNLGTSEGKIKSLVTGLGDMANFLTTDTKSARALETALLDSAGIKSEFQREAKTVSEIAKAQKQVGADATTANSLWQQGVTKVNRSYEDITRKIAQVDAYLASGNYTKAANGVKSIQTQITNAARAAEDMQQRIMGHTVGTTNAAVVSGATAAANDIGTRSAKNVAFFNDEVNRLNIELDALSARLAKTKAEEDEAAAAARRASDALKQQRADANSAANNFFRFRAILALVVSAFYMLTGAIKKWFDMASAYAETNHLLYATLANDLAVYDEANGRALNAVDLFGRSIQSSQKMTDESASAIEGIVGELDKLSDRLQVDPTNLKKTYATFYEMANSAGMAADKVHEVAKGMTQLTYDIGSLWDEDFDSVAKKMRSALGGITTSVRLFGIDISRSAADTYLMEHGIDATYNSLDRASKMLTIYNLLLKGTTTDQDDLARSAAQPANLLRILGEQAQYAGRMLGAAIFPVITPLIALFYNLMKAIQAAAQALSSFLSFVFGSWYTAASDGWNSFLGNLKMGGAAAEEVEEGMDGIAGGAGGAADAAKELKKQLMGFDEINNITPEVDTGGGGGGGGGGGAMPTGGVDIWEQISAALDEVREKIMEFANNAVPNTLKVLASFAYGVAQGFLQGFSVIPGIILTIVGALDHLIGALRLMFGTYEENGETRYYFDDMVEGIGKFIGTLAGLSVGIGLFSKLGSLISGLFSSTGLLFKVFSPLINLLKVPIENGILATMIHLEGSSNVLMAVLKGLLTTFTSLMSPVGIVVAVITALAAAFLYCYNNSAEFREFLSGLIERLSAFGDMIAGMIQPAFEALQGAFANLASAIGLVGSPLDYLVPILEFLISVITTLLQVVIQFIAGIVTGVTYVVEFIVNMVAGFIEIVVGGITSFFAFLGEIFGIGNEEITTDSENMKASVIGAFNGMSLESIPIIGGFLASVFEFFSNAGTNIGTAMDTIGSLVSGGWTYVTTLVGSAFGVLRDTFSTVVDVMAQPFIDAWNKINEIFGWLKGLLSRTLSFPHINVPHFNIDGGQLPWGIGGSGYPPSISVSWYAKGGIATKASLAGIGEAGDEGIIPLQGALMKPFALAISDNINKFGAENVSQSDKEMLNASLAQSALLREQNNLLRQILAKDNSVSIDGREIINSINRQQRVQGRQLIGAY